MNSYNNKLNNGLDWFNSVRRQMDAPLDITSVFHSVDDAERYAIGDSVESDDRGLFNSSYDGQLIAVMGDDEQWRPAVVEKGKGIHVLSFEDEISVQSAISENNILVVKHSSANSKPVQGGVDDVPVNDGVANLLKELNKLASVPVYTVNRLPQQDGNRAYRTISYGIPYSSPRWNSGLVPNCTLLHTFRTALCSPFSDLYMKVLPMDERTSASVDGAQYKEKVNTYYGTVCSALVSHAYNLLIDYPSKCFKCDDATELKDENNNVVTKERVWNIDNLTLGDLLVRFDSVTGKGHVKIVTSITRKDVRQGSPIQKIKTTEAMNPHVMEREYTRQSLESMIEKKNYELVRLNNTSELKYRSLSAERDYDETYSNFILTHPLMPSKGDRCNVLNSENIDFIYSPGTDDDAADQFVLQVKEDGDWVTVQDVEYEYIEYSGDWGNPNTSHRYRLKTPLTAGQYRIYMGGYKPCYFAVSSVEVSDRQGIYTVVCKGPDITTNYPFRVKCVCRETFAGVFQEEAQGVTLYPDNSLSISKQDLSDIISGKSDDVITVVLSTAYGDLRVPVVGSPVRMLGDINNDGAVDEADVAELVKYLNNEDNIDSEDLKYANLYTPEGSSAIEIDREDLGCYCRMFSCPKLD